MKYRIQISKRALKFLQKKVERPRLRQIITTIDALANNPTGAQAVKLDDSKSLWRVRVGDYRIAYQIKDSQLLILVVLVRNRKEFYKVLHRLGFDVGKV